MKEVLIACGDVDLLRQLVSALPQDKLKPIATKRGTGTAAKVAARDLELAIIHEQLEDNASGLLLSELKALPNPPAILWLSTGNPPKDGPFDRAMRYPVPGPVLRAAITSMLPDETQGQDLEQWRTFYRELKERNEANQKRDYFGVLGVPQQAPHHMLVKAFDLLSLRYHPDRYNQFRQERWGEAIFQEANTAYKLITEAYSVLTDRRMAELYQKALAQGELRLDPEQTLKKDTGPKTLEELAQTAQGKKFLRLAQTDISNQQFASALQNLNFALSIEHDNAELREKLAELQAKFAL